MAVNVEIKIPSVVPSEESVTDSVKLNIQNTHDTLEELQSVLYKIAAAIEELS